MRRILIIDDDSKVLNVLARILESGDYLVYSNENGWDGLQCAHQFLPDLIICDIEMPHLDGYSVLEKLRSDPLTETIPFIFLTGRLDKQDMRRGMELGADDYLTKPFTREELLKAVEARLAKVDSWKKKLQINLEELRKSLASSFPHELRTPLTGIIGAAALLRDDKISLSHPEVRKMGEIILSSGERLNRLIHKYLLYQELEEPLKGDERVRESFRKMRAAAKGSDVRMAGEIISDTATLIAKRMQREQDLEIELENASIKVSEEDLREIIEELLDNSFKFSKGGSKVRVKGKLEEGSYVLSIIDQGRGMLPEKISNIGAFVQFDRKKFEQQGMGLGLAIVKRLIAVYNGRLDIESRPNEYTRVTLSLPV